MTELNYMSLSMGGLEIEICHLQFQGELGSGAFGLVRKAIVVTDCKLPTSLAKGMTVAVKSLKGETGEQRKTGVPGKMGENCLDVLTLGFFWGSVSE